MDRSGGVSDFDALVSQAKEIVFSWYSYLGDRSAWEGGAVFYRTKKIGGE